MSELIFIYGTLHPDSAPREIAEVARRLISVGRARVRAHYYDLGEYPGIVLDEAAAPIAGELFSVRDAATLTSLDAYEDFRPGDPAGSLFLRGRTLATLHDGSQRECWVYVWNGERPPDAAADVPQGEWDSKRGDCCAGE